MEAIKNEVQAIELLKKSPLFNLSLASKELFHSNFWEWFFNKHKEKTAAFFERCLNEVLGTITSVNREEKNIDITIQFDTNTCIYIENKIKSIPYEEQLLAYKKTIKGTDFLILLSIHKFTPPRGVHYISYRDLLVLLNEVLETEECQYFRGLYTDYTNFLNCLIFLTDKWSDFEEFDFHRHSGKKNYHLYKEIRLHDFFHKFKYNLLKDALHKNLIEKLHSVDHKKLKPFEYFSNTTGAASLLYILERREIQRGKKNIVEDTIFLEMQIQDNMIRLMLISKGCYNKKHVLESELIGKLFNLIYCEDLSQITGESVYPKKGGFNKFGSNLIYKSKKITETRTKNLVDQSTTFYNKVISFAENNKEQLLKLLKM